MKTYRDPSNYKTANYLYSGSTIHSFKSKAEVNTTYFSKQACQELVNTYETTVKPFYEEKIKNSEVSIEIWTEWLEVEANFNPELKSTFDKLQADYEKLLAKVPVEYKNFLTTKYALGYTWNLPHNFKTPEEFKTTVTIWINDEKPRLAESKQWFAYYTEFYNKALSKLAETL